MLLDNNISLKRVLDDTANHHTMITRSKRRKLNDSSDSSETCSTNSSETSSSDDSSSVTSSNSDILSDDEKELLLEEDDFGTDEENYQKLLNLLKKVDEHAARNFEKIIDIKNNKTPNLMNLLMSNIEDFDRTYLFELYEVLKEYEHGIEEEQVSRLDYINLRDKFNRLYYKYKNKKKNDDDLSKMLNEDIYIIKQRLFSRNDHDMEKKILLLNTDDKNKSVIYKKYKEYDELDDGDEKGKLKNWLNWAISLPYDNVKELPKEDICIILEKVANELDNELYGMEKVKEQILLFLNSKFMNPNFKSNILSFIGIPGIGKTSIAKSLAKILDIPFVQISFGGAKDSSFLKGHDFTYIGSRPGEIVRCLEKLKVKNGIIFLDEFDKISNSEQMIATLLHILDPVQNSAYKDDYLREISIDLSSIWFICSMNHEPKNQALNDRLCKIKVEPYNKDMKFHIVKKYLLPRTFKSFNISPENITFSDDVIKYFVNKISPELSGIRNLEQNLKDLVSKIIFLNNTQSNFEKYPFKISFDLKQKLTFPVNVNEKIIDKCINNNVDKNNNNIFNLYI
jgi:ATP-dependent Lon protease